jgi:hypothetical protein
MASIAGLTVIRGKAMRLVWGALLALSFLSCSAITAGDQRSSVDVKLIGVWTGEYLEEGGTLKRWTQTRNADGTYAIEFSFTGVDGTVRGFIESGRWWIKDGLFHEIALPEKGYPDKYQYFFRKKECVDFVLVESEGFAEEPDSYVFSECLTADSPPARIGGSI